MKGGSLMALWQLVTNAKVLTPKPLRTALHARATKVTTRYAPPSEALPAYTRFGYTNEGGRRQPPEVRVTRAQPGIRQHQPAGIRAMKVQARTGRPSRSGARVTTPRVGTRAASRSEYGSRGFGWGGEAPAGGGLGD